MVGDYKCISSNICQALFVALLETCGFISSFRVYMWNQEETFVQYTNFVSFVSSGYITFRKVKFSAHVDLQ